MWLCPLRATCAGLLAIIIGGGAAQRLDADASGLPSKIRFQLASKPTKAQKSAEGKSGLVPLPLR
jgi:hypothetical protein